MLSMVFVMLTMSIASAERICEVLNEKPDLKNPDQPYTANIMTGEFNATTPSALTNIL